ncbi:TerD family protein [Streptomyces sp. BI20]|uniref:TerD family protein n=1 Tax=Streptomyces sp. BI20 TaxID=3403460 RepID=UPI003C75E5CF
MAAELVRGQNHPVARQRVEITISAGSPVHAVAALGDEAGRPADADAVVHPGRTTGPGITIPAACGPRHRIPVDLDAVTPAVHRISIALVLPPGGPDRFGAVAAPHVAVTDPDGTELAGYTMTDLGPETAVVAVELYRRQGAWKVRAVGQGYADGIAGLLRDQGLPESEILPLAEALRRAAPVPAPATGSPTGSPTIGSPTIGTAHPGRRTTTGPAAGSPYGPGTGPAPVPGPVADTPVPPPTIDYTHRARAPRPATPAPPPGPPAGPPPATDPAAGPPRPVAGDASGWTMDERLYNQVWGVFEDLARAVAAYRGAVDFADNRLERELDQALSDPAARMGGAAHSARATAAARREELVGRAREVLDRDLGQLVAELAVVEPALPAAYARWDSAVWQGHRIPEDRPMAVRLGDLHLPERPGLRVPMLLRLPLERGLWIDSGRTGSEAAMATDTDRLRRAALDLAVAHAVRMLAVHPAGGLSVHVIDAAGAGAGALAPLAASGALAAPPAAGAAGVSATLDLLTRRVDLVQMALRAGAPDELPADLDPADQLLIVHDFPHGFDERSVTRLRYLADEGPAVGVHLLMVADREDAAGYGPLLDPLWRSLLRLSPVPDAHLADPWVGHAWTFEGALPPRDGRLVGEVLDLAAEGRRRRRRGA